MGLFGGKKVKSENSKKALALPRKKKLQYEKRGIDEVESDLQTNIDAILAYTPVNYYASKLVFLQANIYFDEAKVNIYIQFENYRNEKMIDGTDFYPITLDQFKAILRKFGLNPDLL